MITEPLSELKPEKTLTMFYSDYTKHIDYDDGNNGNNTAISKTPLSITVDLYDDSEMMKVKDIVSLSHHSLTWYENHFRSNKNFIESYAVAVDLDDGYCVDEIIYNDLWDDINLIVNSSRSKGVHLIFPLSEPITDCTMANQYSARVKQFLSETYNITYDDKFTGTNFNPARVSGRKTVRDGFEFAYNMNNKFIDEIIIPEKSTQPIIPVKSVFLSRSQSPADIPDEYTTIQNTFDRLDSYSAYCVLSTFASYVKNKITVAEWLKIGNVFITEMGEYQGRKLFHILSDGYKPKSSNLTNTPEMVDKQFDSIIKSSTQKQYFYQLLPIANKTGFSFNFILRISFKFQHKRHETINPMITEALELYAQSKGWEDMHIYKISGSKKYLKFGCEAVLPNTGEIIHTQVTITELKKIWSLHNSVVADIVWTSNINNSFRDITDSNEDRLKDLFVSDVRESVIHSSKSGSYIPASRIREIRNKVFSKSLKAFYSEDKLKEELMNNEVIKSLKSVSKKVNRKVIKVYECHELK